MSDSRSEEVFLPFSAPRATLGVATQVRSTLITSSRRVVEERGIVDRYVALLAKEHRETVLSSIAGVWLAMDAALAHYRAMDGLGFSSTEQVEIGTHVGDRVHGTFLGTMVKMAASAGATPWTALGQSGKLYGRLFRGGGGVGIWKLGPKEARVEIVGLPVAAISYWRAGVRGMYQAGCELFCRKAYVTDVTQLSSPIAIALRVAWA